MDLILLWLITLVLGYWIFKKFKEWQSLPPGPWGVPVLGYLPFLNAKLPHLSLTELSKTYGSIYSVQMGNVFTVVLTDHRLVREAFSKETFSGRAPLFLTHGIMNGKGIICAEGPLWKDQRKLLTTWLKSFGMSKHSASRESLEKRIAVGATELLQPQKPDHANDVSKVTFPVSLTNVAARPAVRRAVRRFIAPPDVETAHKSGKPIDLSNMITNSIGHVINEIIFGFKFPSEDKTWFWLRQIQEEGCHEMGVAGAVNFLPFVRFFSRTLQKTIKVIVRGQAQTHRLYASIVARRRKMLNLSQPEGSECAAHAPAAGPLECVKYSKHAATLEKHYFDPEILKPTDGDCILDNFLSEQKRRFEAKEESARFVTDEQMLYFLADMFGAGLDTSAVSLAWFLLYMALHPDEQESIRNEIQTVYPEEEPVDCERLPRLMAAVCETQRIRSIVPLGVPHGCLQDTQLAGYRIPRGAMVVALQWALHMDPHVWPEPDRFRPSRFLAPDGSLLKPQEFIPFQTGKRMCPGDELSRMVSCGVLTRLLRGWRVRLAGDAPSAEDLLGTVGVTLAPPKVLYHCEKI
ncbi:Cytochrome P450 306a1 [Eumeta japonica]|uniref:Cytochrome P450 306a1 n=1 Tax=Eumeta variegata TaxID=151549 RepID=A0A4C1ZT78_EUMVA|nr:Cytochrome P450 306a1 [Eumeta japonica]